MYNITHRTTKVGFGCHRALTKVAKHVTGIDVYPAGVKLLSDKGFNVLEADVQQFDLGQTFDVIVAGDLIEHLTDFSGFFECCKNHLNTDGVLLISTPNPWHWRYILKAILFTEVSNNDEHTCWICPRTLKQLVKRYGLTVGKVRYGSRYWGDKLMPLPKGIKHTSFHAVINFNNSKLHEVKK